jgi:hypothetical protein
VRATNKIDLQSTTIFLLIKKETLSQLTQQDITSDSKKEEEKQKTTAPSIPAWSPTAVLTEPSPI